MLSVAPSQNNRNRVQIELDSGEVFELPRTLAARHGLLKDGAEATPQQLRRICQEEGRFAREKAMDYLARAGHTTMEVRRYLHRLGVGEEAGQAAIKRMLELKYLDDAAYSRRRSELDREAGKSVRATRQKLLQRGVDRETIRLAVPEDPEGEAAIARELAKQLSRRYAALPEQEASRKVAMSLARRGFTWDTIRRVMDTTGFDLGEDI
nr:RecX family transcriptional regulator [bacterium]